MQEITPFVSSLNHYLSVTIIAGLGIFFVLSVYVLTLLYKKQSSFLVKTISSYILPLGFLITLGGMIMSLYYSEVLHLAACDLCWFQRIFMYPLVFMFGFAWYKKDKHILSYTSLLSGIGFVVALYHHMLQIGYDVYKPCSTSPFAVDCAEPTFIEFGFVTFPFMAVVLFGFVLLFSFIAKYFAK
ncbi:MAG: disulfide bond formation protein B [Candidatus Pacebacteria bacterium]|nr:disulfide bond formation protein B [Candidatus Paceibacterota bacterium]